MMYNGSTQSEPIYGVMTSPIMAVVNPAGQLLQLAVYASAANMTLMVYRFDASDDDTISLALLPEAFIVPINQWTILTVCVPYGVYRLGLVGNDGALEDPNQFLAVDNITVSDERTCRDIDQLPVTSRLYTLCTT